MSKKQPFQKFLRLATAKQGGDYDAQAVLKIFIFFDYPCKIHTRSGFSLSIGSWKLHTNACWPLEHKSKRMDAHFPPNTSVNRIIYRYAHMSKHKSYRLSR